MLPLAEHGGPRGHQGRNYRATLARNPPGLLSKPKRWPVWRYKQPLNCSSVNAQASISGLANITRVKPEGQLKYLLLAPRKSRVPGRPELAHGQADLKHFLRGGHQPAENPEGLPPSAKLCISSQ